MPTDAPTLRIAALAASRIADAAIVQPCRDVDGVELVAVAARDADRAAAAADRWGVDRSFGSYEELLDDEEIDAVYIATPASLHRRWAVAAIEAGKHVLCEKPFAANGADARLIADAAASSDVVVMEAFHWRYHPFAAGIAEVLSRGDIGTIRHVSAVFDIAAGRIAPGDIRWDLALGGGATMDLGCYPLNWVRFAAGPDVEVVSATAECPVPDVDGSLTAQLRWASGATGWIRSSMVAESDGMVAWLRIEGDAGLLVADNPLAPQRGAELRVETAAGATVSTPTDRPTYDFQLEALRDAVNDGTPFPTTAEDGVAMMELIDDCYLAAGLPVRPTLD